MASEAADDDNNHDDKWRDIAIERFGQDIVNATIHLYCGSYREMVHDDNVRGAVPTLTLGSGEGGALPCPWRGNSPNYFFLCLLVRLQFHREANELRLYLDARGERDLRNPKDSSIECMTDATAGALNSPLAEPTLISGEFVPEISMPGHHKGYLSFDAGQFSKAGKYYFTFADFRRNDFFLKLKATFEARGAPRNAMLARKDYESVLLLQVPEEGGLERAFADVEGKICYALPSSPFEGETEEDEKRRFSPYTEDSLLERHETEGGGYKWWVGPNDQVSSEAQRALLFGVGPSGIKSAHLLRERTSDDNNNSL